MVLSSDIRLLAFETLTTAVMAGGTVNDHEGQILECKEDPSRRSHDGVLGAGDPKSDLTAKTVSDAVACFGSADGGIVVLGVDDKQRGPAAFVGTPVDTAWLRNRIRQLVGIEAYIQAHTIATNRVVTITVDPSPVPVSDTSNRYRKRQGRDCHEMTARELGEFSIDRTTADWSAARTPHTSADAAPAAMAQLRTWLRSTSETSREALANLDDAALLRSLGLVGGDGHLNRAGELLVVDLPGRESLIDLSCRSAPGADTEKRIDPQETALATVLGQVEAAIKDRVPTFQKAAGLVVGQIPALPERTVRESIVNAVMHRDWAQRQPVRVELEGTQLTVTSPGGFLPGVSEKTVITTPAKTRNTTLASAMRVLRLAEQEGSGVDRMFRENVRVGLPTPEIHQLPDATAVRCSLVGGEPDIAVMNVVSSLGQPYDNDIDVLLILDTLEKQPDINATGLRPIIQKGQNESDAALKRARDAGLIVETARIGHYRLTDIHRQTLVRRLPYLRRSAAAYEAIVRGLLEAHGEIRSRDIVELLGVSRPTASRVLSAAVDNGLLVKKPSPDAVGAGVFYVATHE